MGDEGVHVHRGLAGGCRRVLVVQVQVGKPPVEAWVEESYKCQTTECMRVVRRGGGWVGSLTWLVGECLF